MPRLGDLYENEHIFDKFHFSWDPNSFRLLTGSYNNNFYVCDAFSNNIKNLTANRPGVKPTSTRNIDYTAKIANTAWHPKQDIVAVGSKDFGFLYVNKNQ